MTSKTRSSSELKSLLIDVLDNSEFHSLFSQIVIENIGQLIKTEVSNKLENATKEIIDLKNEIIILKNEVVKLKSEGSNSFTSVQANKYTNIKNLQNKQTPQDSVASAGIAGVESSSYAAAVTGDLRTLVSPLVPVNVKEMASRSFKPKSIVATLGDSVGDNSSSINKPTNDEFKMVTRKRRRRPTIQGKNTSSNLKGVAKMASIYLSRIDTGSTVESVTDHLNENGFKNFDVKLANSKYPELYKSYVITVPETKLDEVKQPELWPEGACVGNFLYHLAKTRVRKEMDLIKPQVSTHKVSN